MNFPKLLALLAFLHLPALLAQEEDFLDKDWRSEVRNLGDPAQREEINQALAKLGKFPRQELVALLTDPQLAVRLGALELLEEAAGDTFGFNPWGKIPSSPQAKDGDPRNLAALARWQEWAGLEGEIKSSGPTLSDDQLQGYLRDIISGDPERKPRAIRMLEPHGLKAVAAIEQFILDNPGLPQNNLLSLKEAQYHLVLFRNTGDHAANLARDLTRGNRDQQLGALAALRNVGFLAIPIVRDFIDSPDALIRETAVDSILALGHSEVIPLIIPLLQKEEDINVLHAAMRRFRDIGGSEVKALVSTWLDQDNEDLTVSSLETLTKLDGGDSSRFPSMTGAMIGSGSSSPDSEKPSSTAEKVIQLLADPRWRVRTAALEYVTAIKVRQAENEVVRLLSDEDEFVRSKAIEAAVSLKLASAVAKLEGMFLADDDMIGPVTKAFRSMSIPLKDNLIAHLDSRPPDVIVSALGNLRGDNEAALKIITRYAAHPNLDVACAALRVLGASSDNLKFDFAADYLTAALTSGVPEKVAAVLSTLSLPSPNTSSYSSHLDNFIPYDGEPTTLDPLYNAFLDPLKAEKEKPVELAEPEAPKATGGLENLKATLAALATDPTAPSDDSFRAAFLLSRINDDRGIAHLVNNLSSLTTAQRASIADSLYNISSETALPLLRSLLQDDLSDIRKQATYLLFRNNNSTAFVELALEELEKPDTKLKTIELYDYYFEYTSSQSGQGQRILHDWAKKTLENPKSHHEHRILALIALRNTLRASEQDLLTDLFKNENPWVRRAAWHAATTSLPTWVIENFQTLKKDPSPQVRLALPVATGNTGYAWNNQFNDLDSVALRNYSSSSTGTIRLSDPLTEALLELAKNDPHPEVRFESWFTLMSGGKEIDLDAFLKLVPEQPKEARVPARLADYLENNYRRMGKGMRPLLAFAETKTINQAKLPDILQHFSDGQKGSSFTSFATLVNTTETTGQPQKIEGIEDRETIAARRQNLKVIVFYQAGCQQCERAEKHLEDLRSLFPLMEVERRDIRNQDDMLINRALCDRFRVSGAGKTPSFFTQAGAAISPNVAPEDLADLLQKTMEMEDDPSWAEFGETEMVQAKEGIEETFRNLTLLIVIGGGLADGINPCAFATIIFFLSYLQVAKRKPREILMVGISFIAAIFITYLSIGLIFYQFIETIQGYQSFHLARQIMTWTFAGFALLVAVLSLRDGLRARRGNLKGMTLQLPGFLKDRIRQTIRTRARARNYVIAAFITGIIISLLELACTGQIYAPIIFQVQQANVDAVLYLIIYNLAFVLPLVIIFVLAFRGMTSEALVRFQTKHTATVKFATAILFFLLTAIIIFGDKILPHG